METSLLTGKRCCTGWRKSCFQQCWVGGGGEGESSHEIDHILRVQRCSFFTENEARTSPMGAYAPNAHFHANTNQNKTFCFEEWDAA